MKYIIILYNANLQKNKVFRLTSIWFSRNYIRAWLIQQFADIISHYWPVSISIGPNVHTYIYIHIYTYFVYTIQIGFIGMDVWDTSLLKQKNILNIIANLIYCQNSCILMIRIQLQILLTWIIHKTCSKISSCIIFLCVVFVVAEVTHSKL